MLPLLCIVLFVRLVTRVQPFSFNLHCQDAGNLTDGFPSNNDDIWKSRMREVRSNQL